MFKPILRRSLSFRFPQNWPLNRQRLERGAGLGGFCLLFTFCLCATAHAATLNVPTQYSTIQAGINAAANGDTVLVADGTYTGNGNHDIDFNGKNITVKSVNGASNTIIDCGGYASSDGSGNHRGFYIHSGETNVVIDGFTLRNGYTTHINSDLESNYGGGICIVGAIAAIQNCTMSGNTATGGAGGGVYSANNSGSTSLTNCTINGNTATSGGGVCNANRGSSSITLTNCTINGNTATGGFGGGVYNSNSGSITLTNCIISSNTATGGFGGGIWNLNANSGSISLTNCTISGNTATGGSGGGVYNANRGSSSITLTNNIVCSNSGSEVTNEANTVVNPVVIDSDVQGGYTGTGNIDADPLFVNAAGGDYHLKAGSPCIGKGTHTGAPATDLDGKTRPNPPSMGAYEAGSGVPPILPATSKAVLLVHGTWSDASVWDTMTHALLRADFTVEAVNFPTEPETQSNETYIELQGKALGRRIGELITHSGQPSVNLVCHSMGGLAARYYLTHPNLWQNGGTYAGVSKVILLGTPNLGLDSSLLDPVATMTQAHRAAQGPDVNGGNSYATDTYDNWSPAVKEMFTEWEPAPNDMDSLINPYPANLLLSTWPQDSQGGYKSPIQSLSYVFAGVSELIFPIYGPDYNAVNDMLTATPESEPQQHIEYYKQRAHEMGVLYPATTGIWGVQSRRVSPFLVDLNTQPDTSGAKVYMVGGTYPLAFDIKHTQLVVSGPYVASLPNDGIVPTDSALGVDPFTHGYAIYPDATRLVVDTYHTDLPQNDGVATQVVQWLQEIVASGWTARAVTVGADEQTRLLWSNIDGHAGLWSVDGTSSVSYGPTVGPYAGWAATQIAAGPDGLTRVLWNRPDGSAGLWLLNADNTVASTGTAYGPFDGWAATGIAVGTDNETRILWAKSDGSVSYWTVDTSGGISYSPTYGPYPGWTPQFISVGTDSAVHILWVNSDSSAALWAIDATGHVNYTPAYGPFTGWFPVGLATGSDNITHLLWNNVNNAASFWNIDSAGGISLSPVYGPYKGWFATQAAAGGDGQVRLLWTNANGEASFWLVDEAGDESYSPIFGPY